ncbi:MAG: hypothetical protein RL240_2146, partial [Planctomycetota bacterium]
RKKQPLRGLSPHPPPRSPTRGEGSKTIKPPARLPGEDSATRPRAAARFSPSPAGGRGGRGVRVVTAQTQAPQSFTHTDRKLAQSQSRASERAHANSLLPLARWRERGPGGEGGDRATQSAATPYAPRLLIRLPPLARWRERGPGGEGGVRATPSAQ